MHVTRSITYYLNHSFTASCLHLDLDSDVQEAAGLGQSSASRQRTSQPVQAEQSSAGAPQMILDEETGQLVLDQSSLTMQAQPREEYLRREDGHHDTVNSMSYMKRETASRWSPEETDEFYAVSASLSPVCVAPTGFWSLQDRNASKLLKVLCCTRLGTAVLISWPPLACLQGV